MKQENLEEAADKYYPPKTTDLICSPKLVRDAFVEGAKWQAERMYSEEEVLKLVDGAFHIYASSHIYDAKEWLIEQFKNK